MVAMTAASSLLNTGLDGLLHPSNLAQARAQLFSGSECAGLRRYGTEPVGSKYYISKIQNVNPWCGKRGHSQECGRYMAVPRSLEDDCETGNNIEKPEVDELIAAIIYHAEVEGSLTQAFQKISIEDWSKVLSNVGKKHWELALDVFGIFKETSAIFLKPNNGVQRTETDGLPQRNVNILKVYTTMVAVLSRHGKLEEAESILTEVQQLGFGLDLFLYNALLTGYAKKGIADRVLDCMLEMQRIGIQPDNISYEQLAAAYLNMKSPEVKMALEVLDHMHSSNLKPSQKTYSELINACWHRSEVENAEKCFSAMIKAGYSADYKIFFKMMQLHAQKGNYNRTEELFRMLRVAGLQPNAMSYEHLLLAYCKSGCLNQAFSIFRESKLVSTVSKPSLVAYNILLDACAKAGLHLQAMQLYNEICGSGLKANAITYTSAITALVRSGRYAKAEELYRKMLKQNILPTAHTYTSMIHAYAMRGWTRIGHEVSLTMRNSNCIINSVTYNAMLNLYLRGSWYTEAAKVLNEMDSKGIEPGVAGYGILISSCGDSSPEILPLVKALESSQWETCKMAHQLLFLPLYESSESLLEGDNADLPKDIISFLKRMAETKDVEANLSFYNSVMDALWRKGLKRRAKSVTLAARNLLDWYKRPKYAKMKLLLDLRGLSLGAAQVAVLDWLNSVVQTPGIRNNFKMVLITGTGNGGDSVQQQSSKSSTSTEKGIKKAVGATLAELGSPFVEAPHGSGRLVATVHEVINWQAMYGISAALMLLDSNQPYIIQ